MAKRKKKKVSFTINETEIERKERRKKRREEFLSLNLSTRVIKDKRKKDPKYRDFTDDESE